MDDIKLMNNLINIIREADYNYYMCDCPIISDKEYDDYYDQLIQLENKTGIVLDNSPTRKVSGECVDYLKKVKHSIPMLSAKKTKDRNEIVNFSNNSNGFGINGVVSSYKLDGLTLVLKYKNGNFIQALTRGSGDEGEDVTHTAKYIYHLPLKLPREIDLEVRGECVINWNEFKRINSSLEEPYSHPRNLAAGTLRTLDSENIKHRKLEFMAFELVDTSEKKKDTFFNLSSYVGTLAYLSDMGFSTVKYCSPLKLNESNLDYLINYTFDPDDYEYPVDGIIFKYNDLDFGKFLGNTEHHYNNMIAYKWQDELYETTLRDIEWNTTRTGLINPVAIFDEVNIDGAKITKATLHNVSYIENLKLGIGDKIKIYKANKIIPKVHDNLTQSNTYKIPNICPICGGFAHIKENFNHSTKNITKTLVCTNDNCISKLSDYITHYCSKYGMNIVGLSEKTILTLIDNGLINSILDLYTLKDKEEELLSLDGFAKRSVKQLLDSIEKSKETDLEHFIYSLGIMGIGKAQSKIIANHFKTIDNFHSVNTIFDYTQLDSFGEVLHENIHNWLTEPRNYMLYLNLIKILNIKGMKGNTSEILKNNTFVITGSLNHFKNRDEAKSRIEQLGGKVAGSVSKNTSYLVNNDRNSTSGKNKKAKQLNIPIISEDELLTMLGDMN